MYYVYLWKNPLNLVPFYVGKGTRFRYESMRYRNKQVLSHVNRLKSNSTPHVVQLIEVTDNKEALELERFLIGLIGRKDLNSGPLLNHTDGGEGVSNPSENLKEHWRNKSKAAWKDSEIRAKYMTSMNDPDAKERKRIGLIKALNDPSVKIKRSENMKSALILLVCPHCGKTGKGGSMIQWHFANCRKKIDA